MYGLLLENMSDYIITKYGAERWEEIRRLASVDQPSFSVHQVYPENLIPRLSNRAIEVLGVTERDFFEGMGVHFVGFVSQYGYDRVLSVLGRHMRDFLNGLDNLHEYLKFSYPRMRAPSFICENETRQGLTLHYRTKRRGFVYYAMGQIKEVARHFYRKEMGIEVVREELLVDTVHVTFQLTFDNRAFGLASLTMTREEKHLPVSASVLFEIFPFCIVFSSDMVVRSIGNSLMVILPDLVGNKITNWFDLVRPLVAFQFQKILNRTNNIFELVTVEPVLTGRPFDRKRSVLLSDESSSDSSAEKNLRLKGQMIYMDDWRMMMYLGTPVMPDLSSLVSTGLYINDLPMHDFSRDLMLAGTQQSVELKLALDQEQHKSKKLEESMRRLDMEMRRTDELLYQMIPKAVADRLRNGENPIDTCQMFDSVSILFADVVTFTEICSRLSPMEVVSMLNGMYSIFDTLTERNKVYKVETIGDAYMVVSGAPEREDNHAEKVCDMALDMLQAIKGLKDPSTGSHLCIRVGVHSGAVVAGIVGLKMPRYCLFGDSVNTASRMESTSEAMRVHVSQPTRDLLPPCYQLVERGEVQVKGKGCMKTYWLEGRAVKTPQTGEGEDADEEVLEVTPPTDDSAKGSTKDSLELDDDRSVYSPVTFQEIAKRSLASSPKRQAAGRSNSTGSVQPLSSDNARVGLAGFSVARPQHRLALDALDALQVGGTALHAGARLVGVAVGSRTGLLAPTATSAGFDTQRRPSWNPPLQVTSPPTSPSPKGSQRGSLGSLGNLVSLCMGPRRRGSLCVYSVDPDAEVERAEAQDAASVFQRGNLGNLCEGDQYGLKVRPGSRRGSLVQGRPTTPTTAPQPSTPPPPTPPLSAPPSPTPPLSASPTPPEHPLEVRTLVHSGTQVAPPTANHATSPLVFTKTAQILKSPADWICSHVIESSEVGSGLSVVPPPGSSPLPEVSPCTSSPSSDAESDHEAGATSQGAQRAPSLLVQSVPVRTAASEGSLLSSPVRDTVRDQRPGRHRQQQHAKAARQPRQPRQRMPRSQSHHQHFHQHHHHHHACCNTSAATPTLASAPKSPVRHAHPGPRRSKSTTCTVA